MKIFICWSDETSHAVALALGAWIPSVIQAAETYVSPEDMRKGTGWVNDVSKELARSSLGILCVVPGSVAGPWLNFEAGVLSRSLDVSKVIPLLIDVERSALENGPLAQFPSVIFGKAELYQILETINENAEKLRLDEERLRNTFELWWPKLDLDIEAIRGKGINETKQTGKPGKIPDADETEKAPDARKPEKEPETAEPEKTPDVEESEKVQETGKPEKTTDTDKPVKRSSSVKPEKEPERTVETAKKSEAKKSQDTEKSSKPAAAKTVVLEDLEIEMLKVLYDPPGYTPVTAASVGYKLDISAQKVREHLDRLERKNLVREHLFVGRPKEYSIAPKGREYLSKNDLLNKRQNK